MRSEKATAPARNAARIRRPQKARPHVLTARPHESNERPRPDIQARSREVLDNFIEN